MNLSGTFILVLTGEMADIATNLKIPTEPHASANEMVAQTSG